MVETSDLTGSATLYVVVVVAAVLIGTVLAPVVYSAASGPPAEDDASASVAVISLKGPINGAHVDAVREDLRQARQNESIEAVVIEVDSPGGGAAASEQLYLAVRRTAQNMTVVASVTGAAASGGYYGIAPADRIYVTPASVVGSVGVFAQTAPPSSVPSSYVRSSPDKATSTREQVSQQVETLQHVFVSTVMRERGDRLDLDRNEVSHARVYLGANAVDNGMADKIGGTSSAVAYAAAQEDLGNDYDVYYKPKPQLTFGIGFSQSESGSVVYEDSTFGYEGVSTTQYYALWGTVENEENEVIINATG